MESVICVPRSFFNTCNKISTKLQFHFVCVFSGVCGVVDTTDRPIIIKFVFVFVGFLLTMQLEPGVKINCFSSLGSSLNELN